MVTVNYQIETGKGERAKRGTRSGKGNDGGKTRKSARGAATASLNYNMDGGLKREENGRNYGSNGPKKGRGKGEQS